MNREETRNVLSILKGYYPQSYKDLSVKEMEVQLNLWTDMLSDFDYKEVLIAIKQIMLTDKREFAPNIAQINEKIHAMKNPVQLTEYEAWNLIKRAIANGIYGAEKEFEKLPQELKQIVGSPNQLRTWATMDCGELNTVVASNIMRSYKVRAQSVKEYQMLPNNVRDVIESIQFKQIGGGEE